MNGGAVGEPVRVAVVGGGQNCEHEVSLASASAARDALDPARYTAVPLTIGGDGRWSGPDGLLGETAATSLAGALGLIADCAVVLPLLHGPRGEDGTLAALCDLAGVPCAGSPTRAGALAMDKWATKLVAEAVGVPTAPGRLITSASDVDYTGPVVVKPVAAGSSHGVSLVRTPEDLPAALHTAFALDDRVLLEEVITGREIDLAILDDPDTGRRVGPPLEIKVPGGLFDTTTKYDGSAAFTIPAPLSAEESATLTASALRIYDALGCRGVARVDFFLTDGGFILNEVNTMPGMTAESQLPKMLAADGLPYPDLLDKLLREAMSR